MQQSEIDGLKDYLSDLPFVSDDSEGLLSTGQIECHKKGEFIIIAGEGEYKPRILLSGLIRVFFLNKEGVDVTSFFIYEKTYYGSDFLTMKKASVCSFEALEDCISLVLDKQVLKEALQKDIRLLLEYTGILEKSLNARILRENALITKSATARYMDLKKEYPNIEKRVSQTHIASYLGISPVSLSRIRQAIREENKHDF